MILVVLALVAVFVFDDILYFLLFERLFHLRLSGFSRFAILMLIFLLNLLLAYAVYSVMRRQPTTGKEGLVGEMGHALTAIDHNSGWVQVHGERWQAVSKAPIKAGEKVVVVAVEGLCLHVRSEGEA